MKENVLFSIIIDIYIEETDLVDIENWREF